MNPHEKKKAGDFPVCISGKKGKEWAGQAEVAFLQAARVAQCRTRCISRLTAWLSPLLPAHKPFASSFQTCTVRLIECCHPTARYASLPGKLHLTPEHPLWFSAAGPTQRLAPPQRHLAQPDPPHCQPGFGGVSIRLCFPTHPLCPLPPSALDDTPVVTAQPPLSNS